MALVKEIHIPADLPDMPIVGGPILERILREMNAAIDDLDRLLGIEEWQDSLVLGANWAHHGTYPGQIRKGGLGQVWTQGLISWTGGGAPTLNSLICTIPVGYRIGQSSARMYLGGALVEMFSNGEVRYLTGPGNVYMSGVLYIAEG